MPFKTALTPEILMAIRQACLDRAELSHDQRAEAMAKNYPEFSVRMLSEYSRISLQCTEKVLKLYVDGKASLGILSELCSWKKEDQDFIVDDLLAKKLTPVHLQRIKRWRNEEGWGFDECIAKATGKMPVYEPQKRDGPRKSLDGLLTEIADKGARWRAMVTQALEMVQQEEAQAGVHEAIFSKVFVLRQVLKDQLDYVNNRVDRYMRLIRNRLKNGGPSPAEIEDNIKGGDDAHPHTGREKGDEGQVHGADGQPVQDQPGEGDAS